MLCLSYRAADARAGHHRQVIVRQLACPPRTTLSADGLLVLLTEAIGDCDLAGETEVEQQDREYNLALERDRDLMAKWREQEEAAAEQRREEEAEAGRRRSEEERRSHMLAELAARLPEEPPSSSCGSSSSCLHLSLRLLDGCTVERRFRGDTPMHSVFTFAQVSMGRVDTGFRLVSAFPRRVFGPGTVLSLAALRLAGRVRLHAEDKEDEPA